MNLGKLTNPTIWVENGVTGQKAPDPTTQSRRELVLVCVCVCTGERVYTTDHLSYAKLVKLSQIRVSFVCLNDIKSRSTCWAIHFDAPDRIKNKYHGVSWIFTWSHACRKLSVSHLVHLFSFSISPLATDYIPSKPATFVLLPRHSYSRRQYCP